MEKHILQTLFFPFTKDIKEQDLYLVGKNFFITNDKKVRVLSQGTTDFLTYFNSFPVGKYKEYTILKEFKLFLDISEGRGILKLKVRRGKRIFILNTIEISSSININFEVSDFEEIDSLSIEYQAIEDSKIENLLFMTEDKTLRDIKLAICTTTFNREESVNKLSKNLASSKLKNIAHLFIINNGDEIKVEETPFISVIKNKNIGGTGGFMRGLSEAVKHGFFTHCMFIDDDAYCHPESIEKAVEFLSFCRKDDESVAGAMLYEKKPYLQYEAGATIEEFNLTPRNLNFDLTRLDAVAENNLIGRADYGPWWFFIFPIKEKLKYSFPFFVRGDDVTFSLRNNFKPIMMNGICSWQESFDAKISPVTEYLAFRSFIMISLVFLEKSPNFGKLSLLILKRFTSELFGMRYSICRALIESLKDVMKGPEFWKVNMEMKERLGELKNSELEPNIKLIRDGGQLIFNNRYGGKLRKLLTVATLGGNVLPAFFQQKVKTTYGLHSAPFLSLGAKRINYYSEENGLTLSYGRNRKIFFSSLFLALFVLVKFYLNGKKIRREYLQELENFESRKFWEDTFK